MFKQLRPFLLALLFYAGLALFLDWPFLFSHKCLYLADVTYNLEPAARLMRDLWGRAGHIPFWNPYVLCGAPQTQVLWPVLYLPGYIFVFAPFSVATGLFFLLHQLAAGFGAFLWQCVKYQSDRAALKWFPPLLFGVVFMLSGYMAGSTISLNLFASASWIPLALFLIDRILVRPRLWCLGALGFTIGLQVTAGRPEILAGSLLLYFLYFAVELRALSEGAVIPGKQSLLAITTVCGAVVLGFTLSAIDILPMLELASQLPQGTHVSLGMTYWSAGWFDFLSMLLSKAIGPLSMAYSHLYPTYPGDSQYISSLYVGAPVLTLAAIGFSHRQWKLGWFWLTWSAVALVLTAGQFGFVLPFLQGFCPESLLFRFPIKLAIFLILGVCAAACEGARVFLDGGTRSRSLLFVGVTWFMVAAAGLLLLIVPDPHQVTFLPWTGEQLAEIPAGQISRLQRLACELVAAGLSGALSCILFLPAVRRRMPRPVAAAVWTLLVSGLLVLNDSNHLWNYVDDSFFRPVSGYAQLFHDKSGLKPTDFRVLSLLEDPLPAPPVVRSTPAPRMDRSFMQYTRMALRPNTNLDSGIRLANGVSTIPSWVNYFLYTGLLPRSGLMPAVLHPAGKSDLPLYRWCQATSTRFVISAGKRFTPDGATEQMLPWLNSKYFQVVNVDPLLNLRVYSVPAVRPMFSLQSRFRLVSSRVEALTAINRCDRSGWDPMQEVLVTDPQSASGTNANQSSSGSQSEADSDSSQSGMVRVVSRSDERITVSVETPAESYLVMAESFYPGWEAYDNGAPTRVYIADGLLSAVHLTAGRHDIYFVYRPWSLFWGALVSKVSLIVFGFLILSAVLEKRRSPKESK